MLAGDRPVCFRHPATRISLVDWLEADLCPDPRSSIEAFSACLLAALVYLFKRPTSAFAGISLRLRSSACAANSIMHGLHKTFFVADFTTRCGAWAGTSTHTCRRRAPARRRAPGWRFLNPCFLVGDSSSLRTPKVQRLAFFHYRQDVVR